MNPLLKTLADNPLLFEATRELLLCEFKQQMFDESATDEVLGQQTRARLVGIKKVMEAFNKIEKLKTIPPSEERINQAR